MNANVFVTKDYERNDIFTVRINKPNSNPISGMSKMAVNLYIIEEYEIFIPLAGQKNKPKTNPISKAKK